MLEKISSKDASSILKTAGATIRALADRVRDLETENAAFKKEARAKTIATSMEEKGLNNELSFEEKVASLKQREDLDVVEEAIKMASKQNVSFGSLVEDGSGPGGGGLHPFESFLLTGEAPE